MKDQLDDSIQEPDRTWFALAAYNVAAATWTTPANWQPKEG